MNHRAEVVSVPELTIGGDSTQVAEALGHYLMDVA
jgi:hypothetical protein